MQAVVLAAGRGTRMGSLTAATPKPLLSLCGRPIIEHILVGMRAADVREVVVVTGYRGEQIEQTLGNGERLGLRLTYRHQSAVEGTARALALAADAVGGGAFLVSWGDVVVSASEYAAVVEDFTRDHCDALLTVNEVDDPWRGAAVYIDAQRRVTRLVEKPPRGTSTTRWNNAGVFVFRPAIFAYIESLPVSERGEYELPQAVAAMVADGRSVRAHRLRGFWSDLGTPQDLAAAEVALGSDPASSTPAHG